jgi:hypothetical protein
MQKILYRTLSISDPCRDKKSRYNAPYLYFSYCTTICWNLAESAKRHTEGTFDADWQTGRSLFKLHPRAVIKGA